MKMMKCDYCYCQFDVGDIAMVNDYDHDVIVCSEECGDLAVEYDYWLYL
jgi:hypothetical protein